MTKAELVSAMAVKTGLNKAQAKEALDAFIASVSTTLKAGDEVRLVGFGSFVPVKRAAGIARNPRTGEKVRRCRPAGSASGILSRTRSTAEQVPAHCL